jgi:hypothetical protein
LAGASRVTAPENPALAVFSVFGEVVISGYGPGIEHFQQKFVTVLREANAMKQIVRAVPTILLK